MKTLEEVRLEMLAKAMGRPLAKYSLKERVVIYNNNVMFTSHQETAFF